MHILRILRVIREYIKSISMSRSPTAKVAQQRREFDLKLPTYGNGTNQPSVDPCLNSALRDPDTLRSGRGIHK